MFYYSLLPLLYSFILYVFMSEQVWLRAWDKSTLKKIFYNLMKTGLIQSYYSLMDRYTTTGNKNHLRPFIGFLKALDKARGGYQKKPFLKGQKGQEKRPGLLPDLVLFISLLLFDRHQLVYITIHRIITFSTCNKLITATFKGVFH